MQSRSHRPYRSLNQGYSLYELIFCGGLLATMMSMALPSLSHFTESKKLDAAVIQIQRTLSLARSNAISHGKTVLVCPLATQNYRNCVKSQKRNSRWEYGWLVFVDNDENNELTNNDLILSQFETSKSISLIFNQNGSLRFFADGSSRSAGFYLCSKSSKELKHLKLLHSGRTRLVNNLNSGTLKLCKNKLNHD